MFGNPSSKLTQHTGLMEDEHESKSSLSLNPGTNLLPNGQYAIDRPWDLRCAQAAQGRLPVHKHCAKFLNLL